MKQFRFTFTEQEMAQFEQLIGEIPTKFGNPLINMYVPKLETTEIEDNGGSPKPPKPPKPSEE